MTRYTTRGYIPDPPDMPKTSFRHARKAVAATALPAAVDLRAFAPPVADQGGTGSCTGHATAEAIATTLAKAGTPLGFVPSPKGIYTLARCIDRSSTSSHLQDEGAMPNQVMRAISEWGVRPIHAPTSDGRYSDCEPSTINEEPKLNELETDSHALLVGAYAIDSTGAQRVTDICLALASGFAVVCSVSAGNDTFQRWRPENGPLGAQHPVELDHYVWIPAYTTHAGKRVFTIRSSWGTEWADKGELQASEACIAQLGDIYALAVKRV